MDEVTIQDQGQPVEQETKAWYESKTVWINIVAIIFALGGAFAWWPKELNQGDVVNLIMVLVAVLTTVSRWSASKPLTVVKKSNVPSDGAVGGSGGVDNGPSYG